VPSAWGYVESAGLVRVSGGLVRVRIRVRDRVRVRVRVRVRFRVGPSSRRPA